MGTSARNTFSRASLSPNSAFDPESLRWDPLTGLADRQYILNTLSTWLQQSKQRPAITLMLFNIENFRSVNRRMGHRIGDRWLCAVARRLQARADRHCLVGRVSGDEFLLISINPDLRELDLQAQADAIAAVLSKPVAVAGQVLDRVVRASFSHSAGRQLSAEQLLDEAEQRMRAQRRERLSAQPKPERVNKKEFRDLQRAIDVGNQIEVHYQPEVNLCSGEVVGVEALARWQHPRRGLQPASKFIQLAERSGLVVPLSWLVLHRALNQMQIWRQRYPHMALTVRVNASPLQLCNNGFADQVLEALAFHGLPPSMLCVEVTEHQVMKCRSTALKELRTLRAEGVAIALDDFGVGHSSLSRLRDLPADCLKIDRSFVKASCKAARDRSLLEMIARLAEAFSLLVVAEGVESEQELQLLQSLRVSRGQGDFFASAQSAQEVEKLFNRTLFESHAETQGGSQHKPQRPATEAGYAAVLEAPEVSRSRG